MLIPTFQARYEPAFLSYHIWLPAPPEKDKTMLLKVSGPPNYLVLFFWPAKKKKKKKNTLNGPK